MRKSLRGVNGIDWHATEDQARGMSIEALEGAIADCLATLKSADALDRENGTNNGGYYRDVISVYRAAIAVKKREAGG